MQKYANEAFVVLIICLLGLPMNLSAAEAEIPQAESLQAEFPGNTPSQNTLAQNTLSQNNGPWRLAEALNTPRWFSIGGTFRARIEHLDERFRAGQKGSDQALMVRTTIDSELRFGPLAVGAELMDSRAFYNDSGSNVSTGIVNSAELLQGYLKWSAADLLGNNSQSTLRAGRMTVDVGSRRFVARNRFRNTINSFTGVDWRWQQDSGREFRAFYLLPVQRLPSNRAALLDNETEFDSESSDVSFWGLYYKLPAWRNNKLEFFVFGLHEDDDNDRPTRNRELTTAGFRIFREARQSQLDYEIESAYQFGESRTSAAVSNVTDLDHFAHFHHAEIGYSFDYPWQPRVILQYDFASGDDSPVDGDNERLDTLFGARRFDFGPTSIYGPFARSNLSSPGLRIKLKPASSITSFVSYRGFWLASDQDTWTTAGVRDATGNFGSFLGHQIELRIRYNPAPKNIQIEMGIAHIFTGEFIEDAPNANSPDDPTYLYSQVSLAF